MLGNDRYLTLGVRNQIPIDLQLFMLDCIDKLKEEGIELNPLQVFEFQRIRVDDLLIQLVKHRQEVPEYKKNYRLLSAEVVDAKILVIDDGEHSTMMLAEEY